jgi:hypothetical protein
VGDVREGLDVVDGGRHAEGAVLRGKGRLLARLPLLSLQRFEQARLFPADVCAGAAHDHDVVAEAGAHHVFAEKGAFVGLGDGVFERRRRPRVLAAHVDERLLGAGRPGGDDQAFQQLMGAAFEENAVLEGAGLGLVGVTHEVLRPVRLLGHERPLQTRQKARAAAALQAGILDELDYVGR